MGCTSSKDAPEGAAPAVAKVGRGSTCFAHPAPTRALRGTGSIQLEGSWTSGCQIGAPHLAPALPEGLPPRAKLQHRPAPPATHGVVVGPSGRCTAAAPPLAPDPPVPPLPSLQPASGPLKPQTSTSVPGTVLGKPLSVRASGARGCRRRPAVTVASGGCRPPLLSCRDFGKPAVACNPQQPPCPPTPPCFHAGRDG